MTDENIRKNRSCRLELPVWMLLCYSLFTAWQMGVVFFSGEALSLHGKTPLPVSAHNTAAVIVAAYLLSILYVIFFQKYSVQTAKIGVGVSLAAALALYLPLPDVVLAALISVQTFCCVFLIGICISVTVNLFSEKTELLDIFITAVFADVLIAVLQNDIFPVSYAVFHIFTVIALSLILLFFILLPKTPWPEYAVRGKETVKPRSFFAGVYLLIGISCMLTLFGSTVSESVSHGVTVFSLSTAVSGVVVFCLWKLCGLSPLRCGKVLIALGALGFLLALAGGLQPAMLYVSCVLLGSGNLACCLSGFFGIVLMKRYPSRFITPVIIIAAVLTVLLHSALLEAFRDSTEILYILYAVLAVAAAVIYLVIEPYLLWSVKQPDEVNPPENAERENDKTECGEQPEPVKSRSLRELDAVLTSHSSSPLSGQELRVAELILDGFSGAEIAETMSITENTVKSYRKNLYAKLDIHSIRELFLLTENRRKNTIYKEK